MWPTQTPTEWVLEFFPSSKVAGRNADHSPPSSAKVENQWNYTSAPPYAFMPWTGTTFLFNNVRYWWWVNEQMNEWMNEWMNEYEWSVEWCWQGKIEVLREKPSQCHFATYPTWADRGLTWVSAVTGQWLTTWDIAQPGRDWMNCNSTICLFKCTTILKGKHYRIFFK
jgi:hypothetical protein